MSSPPPPSPWLAAGVKQVQGGGARAMVDLALRFGLERNMLGVYKGSTAEADSLISRYTNLWSVPETLE
jgi:hypothetical protein